MSVRLRQFLAPLVAAVALFATAAPGASAAPVEVRIGLGLGTECSAAFRHDDARLGPDRLPDAGPVGRQLFGYLRTGLLGEQQFLSTYYDSAAGSWKYPPSDGYLLLPDGTPIEGETTLRPGQAVDRYGSEYGAFLAPEGLPYANRSIPPSSLDGSPAAGCNYHDYRVLKPFEVHSGPIAPWFGQPGLGLQYQLDGALVPGAPSRLNMAWLVANGYLDRII
ncbi:TNT domain-containing protein [Kitasatospora sp. NPDC088783]|uniref:TNT domain-containing protein n=1 Tax=Kitasatospora sp. NPDC088783 TaxID=3364077 RepID=UPI003830BC8C